MAIKTILIPLAASDAAEAVLAVALPLARQFGAHVVGLHVRPNPRQLVASARIGLPRSISDSVIKASEASVRENAARLRKAFEGRCSEASVPLAESPAGPGGVSAAWHEEMGDESSAVALHGRLADLIVLARPAEGEPDPALLEAAFMASGRPVLLVPLRAGEAVGNTVAIAWNGSAQAARAVAAAMPLLTAAERVLVLSTPEGAEPRLGVNAIADYLGWHGVEAQTHTFESGSRVGRTILAKANELGADLLVMGAYGHSRERELILGGVTRRVLSSAELPVFMAH